MPAVQFPFRYDLPRDVVDLVGSYVSSFGDQLRTPMVTCYRKVS